MKYRIFIAILIIGFINCEVGPVISNYVKNIINMIKQEKQEISTLVPVSEKVSILYRTDFKRFKQSAEVVYYESVKDSDLPNFLEYISRIFSIPDTDKKEFAETFELVAFSDGQESITFKIVSSVNGTKCKYILIVADRKDSVTTEWLIADIKATFELSPNLLFMTETRSNYLGLFKTTAPRIVKIPNNLDSNDLMQIIKYFDVIAFEKFAELMKIGDSESAMFLSYY